MSALREAVVSALISYGPIANDIGWHGEYCFEETSIVFAGHFPGHPVLPAVVQLLMADTILEKSGMILQIKRITHAKFLIPLPPMEQISIIIRPAHQTERWDCFLQTGACTASSLQLELFVP